jgi:hypothetical protein
LMNTKERGSGQSLEQPPPQASSAHILLLLCRRSLNSSVLSSLNVLHRRVCRVWNAYVFDLRYHRSGKLAGRKSYPTCTIFRHIWDWSVSRMGDRICCTHLAFLTTQINFARDFGPRLFSWMAGYGTEVWSAGNYYFWVLRSQL